MPNFQTTSGGRPVSFNPSVSGSAAVPLPNISQPISGGRASMQGILSLPQPQTQVRTISGTSAGRPVFGTQTINVAPPSIGEQAAREQLFGQGQGLFVNPGDDPARGVRRRALARRLRAIRGLEGGDALIPETLEEIEADLSETPGFAEALEMATADARAAGTFSDTEEFREALETEASRRLLAPSLLGERTPTFQAIREQLGLSALPEDLDEALTALFGEAL